MPTQEQRNAIKGQTPLFLGSTRTAHESNKREAFDGMRAYHQSEISHKKDAIDILKTLLTTVVLLFAGLVAAAYKQIAPSDSVIYLAWGLAGLNILAALATTLTTNMKITQDNKRYSAYTLEYKIERDIIGLEDDLKAYNHQSKWIEEKPGKNKSGYHYTKLILTWFAITVSMIGVAGAILVQLASKELEKHPPKKEQTHVIIDNL
jgi:hypothetical protein